MKQQIEENAKYDKIGENSSLPTEEEFLKFLEDMVNKSTDDIVFGNAMKSIYENRPEVIKDIDEWEKELKKK